ncbi:hypothetical protein BSPP4475_16500 [Brevibacillus aydinogluensis]|uniref:Uncharacterized protein n=1 Tax=Brevibacillus aydinogluensis TaxID=927786 RepID=A0AA48MCX1_9BACL|nr:hypothetical protein BSPP4475_16500 [Brevibacillus aydinogluensis]
MTTYLLLYYTLLLLYKDTHLQQFFQISNLNDEVFYVPVIYSTLNSSTFEWREKDTELPGFVSAEDHITLGDGNRQ